MALRREHAKDAARPQRFHQIERDPASGFDLRRARGDIRRQSPDIGEQPIGDVFPKVSLGTGILGYGTVDRADSNARHLNSTQESGGSRLRSDNLSRVDVSAVTESGAGSSRRSWWADSESVPDQGSRFTPCRDVDGLV